MSAFLLGGVCGFDINQNTGEVYVGYAGATGAGPVQIVKVTVDGVMTVIATAGASDDWCGNIKLDKNVPPNIYMASWREGGTPRWYVALDISSFSPFHFSHQQPQFTISRHAGALLR